MISKSKNMTFLEAAKAILEETKQPMHFKKITELAIQKNYLKSKGKTPEWTMGARLSVDIKEKGAHSEFIRTDNGKYGLSKWKKASISKSLANLQNNRKSDNRFWLVAVDKGNFEHDLENNSLDTVAVKYRMRNTLAKLSPGDKVLVYVKKAAEFAAILEVDGEPYIERTDRWPVQGAELAARVKAKSLVILDKDNRIDARSLYNQMEVFTQYPVKHRTLALRNGITEILESDYELVNKLVSK